MRRVRGVVDGPEHVTAEASRAIEDDDRRQTTGDGGWSDG